MAATRPALVFAHYFGGSARSWRPLLDALGDVGDVVVPDLPGFGGTRPFATPTLTDFADDLSARAGDRPWVAVGHSMGGKIALAVAARKLPNLAGLILIAPSPPTPQPMSDDDRQASLDAFDNRKVAERDLTRVACRLSPALMDTVSEDELRVDRSTWRWWLEQGSRDDISPRTQGLRLPTLVITGDHDNVLGAETPAQVARNLADSSLRIVADAGHMVPLEHPRIVARLIRNFLARLAT